MAIAVTVWITANSPTVLTTFFLVNKVTHCILYYVRSGKNSFLEKAIRYKKIARRLFSSVNEPCEKGIGPSRTFVLKIQIFNSRLTLLTYSRRLHLASFPILSIVSGKMSLCSFFMCYMNCFKSKKSFLHTEHFFALALYPI